MSVLMNEKTGFCLAVFLVLAALGLASGDEDFTVAQGLVDARVPCSNLSEEQLVMIGDLFMEKTNPGPTHEAMDAALVEGSEKWKQEHLRVGNALYCQDYLVRTQNPDLRVVIIAFAVVGVFALAFKLTRR